MVRNSCNCNFVSIDEPMLGDIRESSPAYGIEVLPMVGSGSRT